MLVPDVSSFGFLDAPAVESLNIALLTIGYHTAVGPGRSEERRVGKEC